MLTIIYHRNESETIRNPKMVGTRENVKDKLLYWSPSTKMLRKLMAGLTIIPQFKIKITERTHGKLANSAISQTPVSPSIMNEKQKPAASNCQRENTKTRWYDIYLANAKDSPQTTATVYSALKMTKIPCNKRNFCCVGHYGAWRKLFYAFEISVYFFFFAMQRYSM